MIGTYIISNEQEGQRLDVALSSFFPALSLREVRRAWGVYLVELNHRHARKGMFVKAGDEVTITAIPEQLDLPEQFELPELAELPDLAERSELPELAKLAEHAEALQGPKNFKRGMELNALYSTGNMSSTGSTAGTDGMLSTDSTDSMSKLTAKGQALPENSWEKSLPSLCAAEKGKQNATGQIFPKPNLSTLRILHRENGIIAIFKPAGLHSAHVQGGGLSLEKLLPELCTKAKIDPAGVELFNRLDCLTSGIVLATENATAQQASLQAEKQEKAEKRYLAIVRGHILGEFWIKNSLDTDSRRKTKVLPQINSNPLRHTLVRPIHLFSNLSAFAPEQHQLNAKLNESLNLPSANQKACLLEVTIFQGARHQIRAHLASVGYPILGDPLYDPDYEEAWQGLYLHHFAISLPGFLCIAPPLWPINGLGAGNNELEKILKGIFPGMYGFI